MTVSNAYNRPDQLSPGAARARAGRGRRARLLRPQPGGADALPRRDRLGRARPRLRAHHRLLGSRHRPVPAGRRPPGARSAPSGCRSCRRSRAGTPRWCSPPSSTASSSTARRRTIPRYRAVQDRRLPFVLVDYDPGRGPAHGQHRRPRRRRALAEHLLALGHRNFGIVLALTSPPPRRPAAQATAIRHVDGARLAGWREALEAAGIDWSRGARRLGRRAEAGPPAPRPPRRCSTGRTGRRRSSRSTTSSRSASSTPPPARGIARPVAALRRRLRRRPGAATSAPPLTTVRQPHELKGAEAVRLLLEAEGPASVQLPTELVVRASTGPLPERSTP